MREWLRSEPTSLPFSEVWEDLQELLERQHTFETISRGSGFSVSVSTEPRGLTVSAAGGNRYHIAYDTLLAFWQQLRAYGFSTRQIAPGLDREMSYVMAVFARLSYIKPVKVAWEYRGLSRNSDGLQVLPQAFDRAPEQAQLSLFELA